MNEKYLFLWDKRQIDYYDLNDPLTPKNKMSVNFKISAK